MGNQTVDIKNIGVFVEELEHFVPISFIVTDDAELERLAKLGGVLGLTEVAISEPKQKRKATGVPFVKDDPRLWRKGRIKGSENYSTKVMRVLRKMKTKEGKVITEEDFLRLGLIPLFENMTGKMSPRYHKLYMDIVGQIYGKAKETVDHQNDGGKFEPPIITGVRIVKDEE